MSTYFNQQNSHGIRGDEEDDDDDDNDNDLDSLSSSSSLFSNDSQNSSDFMEDATSSSSSSSDHINGGNGNGNGNGDAGAGAGLFEMTSLMQQLPFKRGLSKHFNGKSQSFTSLANVKCLEDLAKPESAPITKKMKSCKSYGGLLCETNIKKKTGTKTISKKSSSPRGSWSSSLSAAAKRNNSFLGNKPPMPPQRSNTPFNQTPLFA